MVLAPLEETGEGDLSLKCEDIASRQVSASQEEEGFHQVLNQRAPEHIYRWLNQPPGLWGVLLFKPSSLLVFCSSSQSCLRLYSFVTETLCLFNSSSTFPLHSAPDNHHSTLCVLLYLLSALCSDYILVKIISLNLSLICHGLGCYDKWYILDFFFSFQSFAPKI